MNLTLEQIKSSVCGLPVSDRAELAHYLLGSLDQDVDEERAKSEWLGLAEQRMVEVRSGTVGGVPAEEVLRSLREPKR